MYYIYIEKQTIYAHVFTDIYIFMYIYSLQYPESLHGFPGGLLLATTFFVDFWVKPHSSPVLI